MKTKDKEELSKFIQEAELNDQMKHLKTIPDIYSCVYYKDPKSKSYLLYTYM